MPAYWAMIGRVILGLFFLSSGIGKIIGEPGAMQEMIRHGFPMVITLYWATAVFETVVGGALLLASRQPGLPRFWRCSLCSPRSRSTLSGTIPPDRWSG